MIPITLPLQADEISLELAGGKGVALAKLARAGLPVPSGFLITTRGYEDFVAASGLGPEVRAIVDLLAGDAGSGPDLSTLAAAQQKIRALFEAAPLPAHLEGAIAAAFATLGSGPVAVRSSATAEDLPDASFAGQQDSFLNVRGAGELVSAVKRCWASLWNARAIDYRVRMGIGQRVSMGVVVQAMVDADASGVLFTANPATGDRSELVVNGGFGLGEAVAAGEITPDSFVLDRRDLSVRKRVIGVKPIMRVAAEDQGTIEKPVPDAQRAQPVLDDESLSRLAALGLEAESVLDGVPQDVEWALASGTCWLLQSRPITRLSVPGPGLSWEAPYKGARLLRRQVVENMPEPLSPLFEEVYLRDGLRHGMDTLIAVLEIPFEMGDVIELPMFVTVNGYGYCRYEFRAAWRLVGLLPRIIVWYVTTLPKWLRNIGGIWRDGLAAYAATIDRFRSKQLGDCSAAELISGIRELAGADATYWFHITIAVGAAKVSEVLLDRFLSFRAVKAEASSALLLRGFPSKTLDARRDLARIAERVNAMPRVRDLLVTAPLPGLTDGLRLLGEAGEDGAAIAAELRGYLAAYGHQVYNLDFVEPTQAEDPVPVLVGLRALVVDAVTPETLLARQDAMVREGEALETDIAASLGPIRRRIFRKLLAWAREYGPYREEALFHMGAAWPTLRAMALELGNRLVAHGVVKHPEDVFYLVTSELRDAARALASGRGAADLSPLVASRRALRELRKGAHPPGRVPEDVRFKIGWLDITSILERWETQRRNPDDMDTLTGFAVSPGTVTGIASVILSPEQFADMPAHTILVCPTTTPAWTPLFGQASGLVTDVGGPLAHGSIVAREYGIPAVLGTGSATRRILSGQRIVVDGTAGTVTILGSG